jgi:hypothetical protein
MVEYGIHILLRFLKRGKNHGGIQNELPSFHKKKSLKILLFFLKKYPKGKY